MKTLLFLRHAKSSWKHDLSDHKRPLKGRGKRDAVLISEHVKSLVNKPQMMIISDAVRAQMTANYFIEAWKMKKEDVVYNHHLYDFSGQQVMEVIKSIDNSLDRVLIVGHNHAFTSIVNMLGNIYMDNLPTCGFVEIEFPVEEWNKVTNGLTKLIVVPRDLKPKKSS